MSKIRSNDLIVLRKKNEEDSNLYIISRDKFEYVELHDCYDEYGQKIGAENAEDYSVENYYCSDLRTQFLEDFRNEIDCEEIEDVNDLLDCDREDVKEQIENWRDENESATICKAFNYFDGNNWQSIIIDCDIEYACNYEEVSEEEYRILAAYENVEFGNYDFGERTGEYDGYEFLQTQYSSDPFEATCIY